MCVWLPIAAGIFLWIMAASVMATIHAVKWAFEPLRARAALLEEQARADAVKDERGLAVQPAEGGSR